MNDEKKMNNDDLLEEMQRLWDMQTQRIDAILDSPEAHLAKVHFDRAPSVVRRRRREYLLLSLLNGALVAFVVLNGSNFDSLQRPLMSVLTILCLAMGILSLRACVLYGCSRRPELRLPQVQPSAALGMALVGILLFVSCATKGDGYAITQNHQGRAEAVARVDTVRSLI